MKTIAKDGFTFETGDGNNLKFSSSKGGFISLRPGEVEVLRALLGTAIGMEKFPALPESIGDHLFRIEFFSNDSLGAYRKDVLNGGKSALFFEWKDIPPLQRLLVEGLNKANDIRVHRPQSPNISTSDHPGIIWEE